MDSPGRSKGSDAVPPSGSAGSTPATGHPDPDRESDLVVADDAELDGRLDVARELRARHLSPVELRADEYRMRLGLLPWRAHAEQARARVTDYGRRTGRTTSALLLSLARCEVEGWPMLAVFGEHAHHRARDLMAALGLSGIRVFGISGLGIRGRGPVVHVDHHEYERAGSAAARMFADVAAANRYPNRRTPYARFEWREPDPAVEMRVEVRNLGMWRRSAEVTDQMIDLGLERHLAELDDLARRNGLELRDRDRSMYAITGALMDICVLIGDARGADVWRRELMVRREHLQHALRRTTSRSSAPPG